MNTDEKLMIDWLRRRKKLLTASDVGAVLGLSPFSSNADVWIDKTTDEIDIKHGFQLEFGHSIEKPVAKWWGIKTNHKVVDPGDFTITVHPDIPWIGATLDREYLDDDGVYRPLEIKNVGNRRVRQDAWTDDPPLYNQMQVMTQISCKQKDRGKLVGLFGYDLAEVDIEFRPDIWELAVYELDKFWNYNVKKKIPPDVIIGGDELESIKRLYPSDDGSTVHLEHLIDVANSWEQAKSERSDAERKVKRLRTKLMLAMGSATFGSLGDGTFLTLKETKKIDGKGFRTLRRKKF